MILLIAYGLGFLCGACAIHFAKSVKDENTDDWDECLSYQKSGLICEVCGCDDGIKCSIEVRPESGECEEVLCADHAKEAGYCMGCGLFCAGMTSYDFHHPGYCDNCWDEISLSSAYRDDNEDLYDEY